MVASPQNVLYLGLNSIVWALLYPSRMFSSVNPRADFTRPLPSAKSRTIQECHPASLHPQDQRKKCAIYKQWRRQRQHRNICSRKSFYGNEPTDRVTQESVSWPHICDLVTSLTWEKYQHEKQKLIHTADTYIHLWTTLLSAVHT